MGIAPADVLLQISEYPKPGSKIDSVDITMQGGGPIPTAMVTLSRLGMKTAMIAAVGDDTFGDFVKAELDKDGVEIKMIIVKKQPTAIAFGWIERGSGRRTIALNLKTAIKPNDIDFEPFPFAALFILMAVIGPPA